MQSLVAFSLLVVAALADPQVYPYGYGYTAGVYPGVYGAYPYTVGGYVAGSSPVIAKAAFPYVAVPSQDTSRGLPQPVEDTAEVKAAKANFAAEYYRTAARAAVASPLVSVPYGTPVVAVESRHKRDLTAYKTPASTTPLVYARSAVAPIAAATYAAPYAAPYAAAAPYVYGGAYYNTAAYSYPYAAAAPAVTYAY